MIKKIPSIHLFGTLKGPPPAKKSFGEDLTSTSYAHTQYANQNTFNTTMVSITMKQFVLLVASIATFSSAQAQDGCTLEQRQACLNVANMPRDDFYRYVVYLRLIFSETGFVVGLLRKALEGRPAFC